MSTTSEEEGQTRLEGLVQELLEWYQAVSFPDLQATVMSALDTDERKLAYVLTAPDRSLRRIADLIEEALGEGPNFSKIGSWQREWVRSGLMRQISKQKREPIFDIENRFGIELPVNVEALVEEAEES